MVQRTGTPQQRPSYEKWRINPADNRYEYFGNTNWYKIFYKDYTTGHQHNLSITGGTDKASYYVSGRFFHQDGIYNAGDERYNQYNVLAKGTVQATKWLRVENTTSFMSRFSHQPTLTTGGQSFTVTPTRMMNHQGFPMTLERTPTEPGPTRPSTWAGPDSSKGTRGAKTTSST